MATRFQIRIYPAGSPSEGRTLSPAQVLSASWRVTRLAGFADASFTLAGLASDHPGLTPDCRVEFWGYDDKTLGYTRLYRGRVLFVRDVGRSLNANPKTGKGLAPRTVSVQLYGLWLRVSRQVSYQRYLYTSATDVSSVFTSLLSRWASPALVGAYSVGTTASGVTLTELDAWRQSIGAVVDRLDGIAAGQIVAGCDVDSLGGDRLFLRPFDTAATLIAPLPDPHKRVESIENLIDARERANVLHLRGGRASYPNLMAVLTQGQDGSGEGGNSGFQRPRLGGAGYGNLLINGGFEANLSNWTTTGNPAIKDAGDPEGPPYEGLNLLEMDNHSGGAESLAQVVSGGTIVGGAKYTIAWAARAETAGPVVPEGLVTLEWLTGAATISTHNVNFGGGGSPIPATWTEYDNETTAPLLADGVRVILSAPVASNTKGILWDAINLYRSDTLYQEGWEVAIDAGASVSELATVVESPVNHLNAALQPFFGAYCTFMRVLAATGTQKAYLQPRGLSSVAVQGGSSYRVSKWSLSPVGAGAGTPGRFLVLEELREDKTTITTTRTALGSGPFAAWTQESFTKRLNQSTRFVRVWEEWTAPGALYSGAFSLRDSRALASEFIEGDALEATLRADDAALALAPPVSTSIVDLGVWPDLVEQGAVSTDSEARVFASAALTQRAREQERPKVVWVGSPTLPGSSSAPMPGQLVRGMGDTGLALLPDATPIVEISGQWDGGMMRMTASLGLDPETEARIIQKMIQKQSKGR